MTKKLEIRKQKMLMDQSQKVVALRSLDGID